LFTYLPTYKNKKFAEGEAVFILTHVVSKHVTLHVILLVKILSTFTAHVSFVAGYVVTIVPLITHKSFSNYKSGLKVRQGVYKFSQANFQEGF